MQPLPKKELGQHWLEDVQILKSIAGCAQLSESDTILEIGPGLGTLTKVLAQTGAHVVALEYDHELAQQLQSRVPSVDSAQLSVIEGDIRTFDLTTLPKNYKIVANIPYYLTSNLIRILTETRNMPHVAVLLMQKEVAERIAHSGAKKSLLTVIAQLQYECTLGDVVPAGLFTPPPKVDSQILVMTRLSKPRIDAERIQLIRLLKAGFSEKRKNLRNALSGGLAQDKSYIDEVLLSSKIEPTRRAESLEWEEWSRLYRVIYG